MIKLGVGVVRDKNGKPKFDNPANLSEHEKAAFRQVLTASDLAKMTTDEKKGLGYGHHAND